MSTCAEPILWRNLRCEIARVIRIRLALKFREETSLDKDADKTSDRVQSRERMLDKGTRMMAKARCRKDANGRKLHQTVPQVILQDHLDKEDDLAAHHEDHRCHHQGRLGPQVLQPGHRTHQDMLDKVLGLQLRLFLQAGHHRVLLLLQAGHHQVLQALQALLGLQVRQVEFQSITKLKLWHCVRFNWTR